MRASHCGGFSCCRARALDRGLSTSDAWAQLLCGMWDLPGPGLEFMSPALAGEFLTTAPPGKPSLPILSEERGTVLFWVCLSNLPEGLYIHTEPVPTQYLLTRKPQLGASLVAQWLRVCLPMQGTQVRALVREDPTCHGAIGPVSQNY